MILVLVEEMGGGRRGEEWLTEHDGNVNEEVEEIEEVAFAGPY